MAGGKPRAGVDPKKPGTTETPVPFYDDPYKNANPGDTATTKGILDDAVVQAFEDAGFGEDHNLSNLKLALGTIACALALVAQFWPNPLKPMPFPDSRPLLLVCCVLYFLLSFILQLITTFYEKDTILYTVPPGPESSFHQALQGKRIKVSTRLNRFSIDYTLKFEVVDASGNTVVTDERVLKLTDYFEEKGAFHEDFFMDDVDEALGALGSKKMN